MRRADRLFRIVQHLRNGRLSTAAQLAGRMEVSERTIYRDIADLQASGVPIEGEAGVGYLMRDGYDLPPLMFTREEVVALVAGARMVRAFGGLAMARGAEEALGKIESALPPAERDRLRRVAIRAPDFRSDHATRARLDELERACADQRFVEIDYRDAAGAETRRRLQPLGLWFWGGTWTLIGWCELRGDFRMFRIDRMSAMTIASESFRPQPGRTLRDFYDRMRANGEVCPGFDFEAAGL